MYSLQYKGNNEEVMKLDTAIDVICIIMQI